MAVKKSTAKKVAKKSAAKKSAPKKSAVKKSSSKASVAKKSVVKKTAKKSAVKKAVKKSPAKKSVVKKSTPKKRAIKKSAAKKPVDKFVVPELPVAASRASRVEVVSTSAPVAAPIPVVSSAPISTPPSKKQGPSSRVLVALAFGIVLLAAIVWSQANKNDADKTNKPSPTPAASATMSDSHSSSPTPEATTPEATTPEATTPAATNVSTHEAPQNAIGNYTATGLKLTWRSPSATEGLTGYNIEISSNGGEWKIISTLPSSQLYLELAKGSADGWTSVRISSVYSDDTTVAAKAFGFPGQFS